MILTFICIIVCEGTHMELGRTLKKQKIKGYEVKNFGDYLINVL